MKQSLKEPTVILFMSVACGLLFFLPFAVNSIGWPLDEAAPTQISSLGLGVSVGKLKSSRILQSQITSASGAALTLAADDQTDKEDGTEDGKDETEGPDRLWDSAMLG